MTSKCRSPAAALLRNSRLMAMPQPIPAPPSHNIYAPPPAPYPTMQAIATPPASHARGEWGLKRDLPLKTKNVYLRYKDLDTLEHFTTFESAHDDVFTLRKWQEMDIPLTKSPLLPGKSTSFEYPETVFDGNMETHPETYQWRYNAPLLSSMTPGELQAFIKKHVKPRRTEFSLFVTKAAQRKKLSQEYKKMDIAPPESELAKIEELRVGDPADLLPLRNDPVELQRMVASFLGLPVDVAPYRVHPSAGLHYTRSAAYLPNDPHHGPQQIPRPILGRHLNFAPQVGMLVGVGGIVAKVDDSSTINRGGPRNENRFSTSHYSPHKAFIDSNGRINLTVSPAEPYGTQPKHVGFQSQSDRMKGFVPDASTGWGDASARSKAPGYDELRASFQQKFGFSLKRAQGERGYGLGGSMRSRGNGEAADSIAALYNNSTPGRR
ncbi:hypothetical protein RUND412_004493 [Rhizina undulata]